MHRDSLALRAGARANNHRPSYPALPLGRDTGEPGAKSKTLHREYRRMEGKRKGKNYLPMEQSEHIQETNLHVCR